MDDTEGLFVFGGTEATHSFKGYIGQATFFRGRVIDPTRVGYFFETLYFEVKIS